MKKDYKEFIISKGGKELGLLWSDIKHNLLTPKEYKRFSDWMMGQKLKEGWAEFVPACCVLDSQSDDGKEVHMLPLVYVDDFVRFIKGLPVID